jgi:uncharacterized linocin/CFP29 family protein
MSDHQANEWEVRITVLYNDCEVTTSDARGEGPVSALYAAINDLQRWALDHEASGAGSVDLASVEELQ